MLVLTRKEGESVAVGDDILVSVVRCSGKKVVLGFDAPDAVRILRRELQQRMDKANAEFRIAAEVFDAECEVPS